MDRLTEKEEQGNWCLKGVPWEKLHEGQLITRELWERLYGALWKLMEYENTGLKPEEVDELKDFCRNPLNTAVPVLEYEENSRWIPVEERLPEEGEPVWATVKHSEWINDYDSDWVPEEEKVHHAESSGVYKAECIGNGIWKFSDDDGWVYCDAVEKEKRNLANVYDTVIAWMPLPEPYRDNEEN